MKKIIRISSVIILLVIYLFFIKNNAFGKIRNSSNEPTKVVSSQKISKRETKINIDWRKPSENRPYPTLSIEDTILVDTSKNRVYIKKDSKVVYTMLCSTGSESSPTPKGDYEIQEKGEHFYNNQSGEGANYYVSFKDHGVYLFHSVPVDENGNYIEREASMLGKKSNSHGCVRLSVPDAKWFYENAIEGMKVKII